MALQEFQERQVDLELHTSAETSAAHGHAAIPTIAALPPSFLLLRLDGFQSPAPPRLPDLTKISPVSIAIGG